ncbi:MAG: S1 RNA-binding domain-containing protein, partial [Acidobacteriota bacterium]|nr:S1 RNA-binding domain-containing protein [Acidobacteriota bacterium]
DRDRQRISLGLKQTQDDPWQRMVDTSSVGDELAGNVTKVVPFGAFVEVLDGVEGLVHISELAPRHVENPREIVRSADAIRVKILEIDSERRRLSLSAKRVEDQVLPLHREPEAESEAEAELEAEPEATPAGSDASAQAEDAAGASAEQSDAPEGASEEGDPGVPADQPTAGAEPESAGAEDLDVAAEPSPEEATGETATDADAARNGAHAEGAPEEMLQGAGEPVKD